MPQVTLLPSGATVEVAEGTVISDAITEAGLDFNLPCAGQGRCGRCKVKIEQGEVHRRAITRLSSAELAEGYVLACQTLITEDITVLIPPQDQMIVRELPGEQRVEPKIELPLPCDWTRDPAVKKFFVTIQPPSLDDNTNDFERLCRELSLKHGIPEPKTGLPVLRKLSGTLRAADWVVTAVLQSHDWLRDYETPQLLDVVADNQTDTLWGLAVDIGTTSNVVYLVDMQNGRVADIESDYNGQIKYGEDVISRIIFAKKGDGLAKLQSAVINTLNRLIATLAARNNIDSRQIYTMTVAGNTTMIHLFLALPPEYIRREPYIPTLNHPPPFRAGELNLNINPEATVDCLPSVGAYVGADITAGVLSSKMFAAEKLTLFVDIGTNGEMVLGNADWLIACACSAGPAFEGSGVQSGMRATAGAIEDVWINNNTYEPTYRVIGNVPPRGLCGSGIISLLAEMFITGVIDRAGKINLSLNTPRVRERDSRAEYVIAWAGETESGAHDIVITGTDMENLLRAKAAIYAGFSTLTKSVGITMDDVEEILIGGAFGKYINIEKAIQIGMLPDRPLEQFKFLGNTSAAGAYASLLCPAFRKEVMNIGKKMTYLELSADNTFTDEFMSAMFFPHTDTAAFPSVMKLLQNNKTD